MLGAVLGTVSSMDKAVPNFPPLVELTLHLGEIGFQQNKFIDDTELNIKQ